MKDQKQRIGAFIVQAYFLTVGKPYGFETEDDFYKHVAQTGFEFVSLPIGDPFIDVDVALQSHGYKDDFQARFQGFGLEYGVSRFEMHVIGQNVCIDPSRILKFGNFLFPNSFESKNHSDLEAKAATEMRRAIDLSYQFGFKHLVGFCGGRGYAKGQSKWSAYPKFFKQWSLALLAEKWEPLLEYAADREVTILFEFGHPENDLLTGENFSTFWDMLSEKAQKAVGINADGSHFWNAAHSPVPHLKRAFQDTGCTFSNHYKGGAAIDSNDGTASVYGGFDDWSEASTSFYTIGTVGDEVDIRLFHDFNAQRHQDQPEGNHIHWEGECVGIPNPLQAMRVGFENCKALRDETALTRLTDTAPPGNMILPYSSPSGTPGLKTDTGSMIEEIKSWEGGPFDAFAEGAVPAWKLLSMTLEEHTLVERRLEKAGLSDAAAAT